MRIEILSPDDENLAEMKSGAGRLLSASIIVITVEVGAYWLPEIPHFIVRIKHPDDLPTKEKAPSKSVVPDAKVILEGVRVGGSKAKSSSSGHFSAFTSMSVLRNGVFVRTYAKE
jgi:hypothetical protein